MTLNRSLLKYSARGHNQCGVCGKFKKYKQLRMTRFIPDNEFSGEIIEMTCTDCLRKEKK